MKAILGLSALVAILTLSEPVGAQTDYPAKPVKIIIPFGPGTVDVICREAAQVLTTQFKQQFYSENRAGAAGLIGNKAAASSAPDGYTLLCTSSGMATEQALRPNSGFDGTRDLAAIAPFVQGFYGIYVNADVPAKTIAEFAEFARRSPTKLKFASAGIGSSQHLATEKLIRSLNLDLLHVPYNGGGDAVLSVVRKETHLLVVDHVQVKSLAENGDLRLIALSAQQRFPAYPNLPTVIESGVPGYTTGFWFALFAPEKTDPTIIKKLSDALRAHYTTPDVEKSHLDRGYRTLWSNPDDLKNRLASDIADWTKIIADAGIKLQ